MKSFLFLTASLLVHSFGFAQTQHVGIGTTTPAFKLDVVNGSINTDSVYRIGTLTVLSVPGIGNLFVGQYAGKINEGSFNTYNGQYAGYFNTNGFSNSFFGAQAGPNNNTGKYNSFFGTNTGFTNTNGFDNSFFGAEAGAFNTTGNYNSFFGRQAGISNTSGYANSFFGWYAGYANTTGSYNTIMGESANVSTGILTNATAIGARSRVDCNNCMVLGSVNGINGATAGVNVGIGVNSPSAKLEVAGQVKITGGVPGAGKVLTSDATGLASWQSPPPPPPPPTYYQSVSICCQSWMSKNLDVTNYRNGDPIPKVTDQAAWGALTTGAYCYNNNDSTNYAAYGKLYNWYAVNDPRGLAPEGWHVPTDFEWTTLSTCLGGEAVAGGPMKEPDTLHWAPPNYGATNLSGFTGFAGSYRDGEGSFYGNEDIGIFWSATAFDTFNVWYRYLGSNNVELTRNSFDKGGGFSVRCIKD